MNQQVSWKKNLYIITIAEFLAVSGYTVVNPIAPLYLQHLGNFNNQEAAFWTGIAIGGSAFAMFFSAPFWGLVSDRFGRKPMVLRSLFGGALVVALYVIFNNAFAFVGFRIIQGIFAGTITAATAMLVTITPRDKVPFSMGVLMGGVYAGYAFGPMMGGFFADNFGFTTTFLITVALLIAGGLMVTFLTQENFKRPAKGQAASFGSMMRLAVSPELLPLLMVITAMNLGPQVITPIVTLRISEIDPLGNVASAAGLAFALMGVFSAISSLTIARVNKKYSLRHILVYSCFISGLLYLPPIWANTVTGIVITVGLTGLLTGGTLISSNSLISYSVPASLQGVAYGLSQSASALGRGTGPIIGGTLVPVLGLSPVFGVTTVIFFLAGILGWWLLARGKRERGQKTSVPRSDS